MRGSDDPDSTHPKLGKPSSMTDDNGKVNGTGHLNVELDEVDGELSRRVEREDGVLLDRPHPPVRRPQLVHAAAPVPDHGEPRRLKRHSNAVTT